ncbi:hypothetical protein MFS40622_0902 [Methanocaldococcus sp. FS406-22]|jgi:hypothetical protein|uniref:hypothetical protein n=1 Tax=Methanocaldococcus sp. (strain FS406-22) TaxID=644281 RepID=UPI0001BF53C0|nr:hypothetical protein [Methanocaldococcus sp. FS406-22]ADC69584.1 hypothetical protein MFS40622_0902 [Methanocaldococcus sp. FS406-22]
MIVNIKELTHLMDTIKIKKRCSKKMVGKYKDLIPLGKESSTYLKELREEEYD